VWSPDRRTIAYTRAADAGIELRAVNSDGGADVRITDHLTADSRATWSPDGTKLVFETDAAVSGQQDLVIFDLGTQKKTLLTNDALVETDPAWSPDGTRIAFWRQQGTNQDLWIVTVDEAIAAAASGPSAKLSGTQISQDPALDQDPAWSPDGTQIAFSSHRNGHWYLFVVDAHGGTARQLTSDTSEALAPAWSPDGTQIVFDNRAGTSELDVINADGSNQHQLTNHPGLDGIPAWRSPQTP